MKRNADGSPGGGFLIGGLMLLLAVSAVFAGTIRPLYQSYQARRWPTVSGTVVSSRLAVTYGPKGSTNYEVDLRYQYAVDGRSYIGTRYDANAGLYSGWQEPKKAVIDANPRGKSVTVYYDPAAPTNALLSTAVPPGTISIMFFPTMFGLFGLLFIATGLNARRKRRVQAQVLHPHI